MRSAGWALLVALLSALSAVASSGSEEPELRCGNLAPVGWRCTDDDDERLGDREVQAGVVPEGFAGHITMKLLKVGSNGQVGFTWECDALLLGQVEVLGTGVEVPLTDCGDPSRHGDLGPGDRVVLYCETGTYQGIPALGPAGKWGCFVDLLDEDDA